MPAVTAAPKNMTVDPISDCDEQLLRDILEAAIKADPEQTTLNSEPLVADATLPSQVVETSSNIEEVSADEVLSSDRDDLVEPDMPVSSEAVSPPSPPASLSTSPCNVAESCSNGSEVSVADNVPSSERVDLIEPDISLSSATRDSRSDVTDILPPSPLPVLSMMPQIRPAVQHSVVEAADSTNVFNAMNTKHQPPAERAASVQTEQIVPPCSVQSSDSGMGERETTTQSEAVRNSDNQAHETVSDAASAAHTTSNSASSTTTKKDAQVRELVALPPLAPGEYDTVIPTTQSGQMTIKVKIKADGTTVFGGYKRFANGVEEIAERQKLCRAIDDQIIAVGNVCVRKKDGREIFALLRDEATKNKKIRLRFRSKSVPITDSRKMTNGATISNVGTSHNKLQFILSPVTVKDTRPTSTNEKRPPHSNVLATVPLATSIDERRRPFSNVLATTPLPPLAPGEYDTTIACTISGQLMIELRSKGDCVWFHRYLRFPDGTKGLAELRNVCRCYGDRIIAIDGVSVLQKHSKETIKLLQKKAKSHSHVYIRFRPTETVGPYTAATKSIASTERVAVPAVNNKRICRAHNVDTWLLPMPHNNIPQDVRQQVVFTFPPSPYSPQMESNVGRQIFPRATVKNTASTKQTARTTESGEETYFSAILKKLPSSSTSLTEIEI